ncbi:hypothetical protein Ddye_022961 [Dipteronia dyeriana]|uniref:Transposase-associated domain-containing protein n=1 Tax=Dipteronia dyeriana TaxID=168575 RepID=A0AAD9TT08_9ROSI|nr:hypothetical protein Ddye_022961 [Dipteronia dyeriana]
MRLGYTTWHCHGENGESDDESEIDTKPHDSQNDDTCNLIEKAHPQEPNGYAKEFHNWLEKCLATYGFNPYGNMNVGHSTWPVSFFPYNLPPWMCMKEPYTFMSLLTPSPKGPGNDIDVYLGPLIDELNELWENGVNTYDISTQQNFQMKVVIMWTINDFSAYTYMSGWSTKGSLACPCCAKKTYHLSLTNGSKICYMGHCRFLPEDHVRRRREKHQSGQPVMQF